MQKTFHKVYLYTNKGVLIHLVFQSAFSYLYFTQTGMEQRRFGIIAKRRFFSQLGIENGKEGKKHDNL